MTGNDRPLPASDSLVRIVDEDFPAAVAELSRLVRIPSVSWDGFDAATVAASAEAVAEAARRTGVFDDVRVVRTAAQEGHPAVLATRAARAGRPTVLLYAHHDVQPPGDASLWTSAPYEPTVRGDRLYGRGASDDKAGVETHLAALRALAAAKDGALDVGIVLFVEGEEEFGSGSLPELLDTYREQLASDVIVIADSDNWSTTVPALTVSLRGNATFQLTVETLDHAVHSGMFGGAAPDAMLATIRLLATLWDETGAVAVPGLTAHTAIAAPDYPEDDFRRDAGLLDGVRPIGPGELHAQQWYGPAITVTGIDAPTVQNASNTLAASVRVQVSLRVAPGQSAADAYAAVETHLRANAPFGARLSFSDPSLGEAFLVDTAGWAFEDATSALGEGWGAEVVQQGVGGSIPFVAQLAEQYPDAQILVTGVEDPDSRAHAPDESQHLGVLKRAILGEALLLARLDARVL